MAKQVIKRDGTKETFDPEKIKKSVDFAVRNAGNSVGKIDEVVERVSAVAIEFAAGKKEVATIKLAKIIFKELEKIAPPAAAVWKKYEEEKNSA